MKLSIIIPVYNTEKYVEKCIQSCINQDADKSEYEIIVVNDGSTDHSLELINKLAAKEENIKVISQANGGLSAARNAGIDRAVGDYLWFVDSDDWIEENCLQAILKKIEETRVDILSIYADDVEDGRRNLRGRYTQIGIVTGREFLIKHKRYNCSQFYIFRRRLLADTGLRFYEGILHEDNEFTPRTIYRARRVTNIEGYYYHMLKRPGSITTTPNPKKLYDLVKIAENYKRYVEELPLSDKPLFYNVIANNINQAMFECYKYDEDVCKEINDRISEGRYAKYLIRSTMLKYKIEGGLFGIFPKNCLRIYFLMQHFNTDKGGQKKAKIRVEDLFQI